MQNRQVFRSTKILDRKDRLLYELFDPQAGKRTSVKLAEISPHLIDATIAIEDATFRENPGISVRGTLRAVWSNLRGEEIQGGSTITQQLIKRVLLTPEVSIERKVQEWILAYRVNQQYTKDQVLEWYLNEIYYGNMAYGVEAAAESYFGKSAKDLDLAEASMLAGIPQSPALLSPLVDTAAAKRRQRMVLEAMVRQEQITDAQAEAAFRQPLEYQPMQYGIEAPHFVMYVRDLLERKYGPQVLYSQGLTVRTTIDLDMQRTAEGIARRQVEKLAKDNIHNAAVVAMNPATGEILTMLGSVDYFNRSISGQVNIATAERQPGSTFKPITYAGTFVKGWGPGTVILDNYTVFHDRAGRPYTPKNVDKKWHGPVTVRTALSNSMNVPAVKALEYVGVKNAINLAHQMGITSLDPEGPYDLSVTLGGGEVKLLDLVFAYSVFANGGVMNGQPVPKEAQRPGYRTLEPVAILKVEDSSGRILEEYTGPQRAEVLKPQVAHLITSILSDNAARTPLFGPNGPLKLTRPAAAKTGTTDDNRDLWTVGYTPDLVAGVWVGNSDNAEIAAVLSSLTAAPIWHDFMEEVAAGTPARDFEQPGGLERIEICPTHGLKPNKYCPTKTTELFVKGTAPTKECDIHRLVVIDKTSGKLAGPSTPPENREEKVVEVYPAEWAAWAKEAGKPEPPQPAEDQSAGQAPQPVTSRDDNSTLVLDSPTTGAAVRGTAEIRGTAAGKAFASFRIEYGEGSNPTAWKPIGAVHTSPVENGVLERWDTKSLNGLYKLRITLVGRPVAPPPPAPTPVRPGATPQPAPPPAPTAVPVAPAPKVIEVPVIVDNQAPSVNITFPQENATIKKEQIERIDLTAQVSDNHRISKTDFYVDDQLVGSSSAAPATVQWPSAPGQHTLRAVVRDVAGNETKSKDVKFRVQ
ncbi:MAG: PBP1A family penicillin-binding protein [Chloroflexota bacterium]